MTKLYKHDVRVDDFKINGGNSIDCFVTDNDPFKFNAGQVHKHDF